MSRRLLLFAALLLAAAPALASKHTWLGTSSNRVSDAANWSGGSPVGDPDAELVFEYDAAQFDVVNDVPLLRFKSLTFSYQGFTLSGAPLQTTDGSISGPTGVRILCDLSIEGTLSVSGTFDVDLGGAISGSGGVSILYGTVRFSGGRPNTYAGETVMYGGNLILEKYGAVAVPGTLRMVNASTLNRVTIATPEQIADSASVIMPKDSGELRIGADETIRRLELSRTAFSVAPADKPLPTLTILESLVPAEGSNDIRTSLRLKQSVLEVPKGHSLDTTVESGKTSVPDGGITLHGGGNVLWRGDYSAPTRIDGVLAFLRIPNSNVEVLAGTFAGTAASLTATGGTIDGVVSASDIRLGPGVTLQANTPTELNGTLELNDATFEMTPSVFSEGQPIKIINNKSTRPVVGTFKGVPEGGIALNRWRVTYRGGDGNDVVVTDLLKPVASVLVTQDPQPAYVGEPVTLTASVAGSAGEATGSISFRRGNGEPLGTATLSGGKASLTVTLSTPEQFVYTRYFGDEHYASGIETGSAFQVTYRKPVIASLDPAEAPFGTKVAMTIRGANFVPGSYVSGGAFSSAEVVSPSEIRTTLDLSLVRTEGQFSVTVAAPGGSIYSDPKPFTVRAPQQPDSPLRIEGNTATLTITPNAKSVWLTAGTTGRLTQFITDSDGDGVVQWVWPTTIPNEVFAVVDLTSGNYVVRGNHSVLADVQPFPAHTFFRDASHFVLPLSSAFTWTSESLLWVRPGVGAWLMFVTDGGTGDDDHLQNRLIFGSLAAMRPLGDSPVAPVGLAAGDLVLAVPRLGTFPFSFAVTVLASRLGAELDDPAPGTITALQRRWSFHENDKTAVLPVIRTGGAAGTVSVRYHTVDRNFTGGIYFVPTSGTLTFGPGETLKTIEIPLIDDAANRGYGSFDVAISDPTGGATLGDETEFVVSVSDDDPPPAVHVVGSTERHVIRGNAPTTLPLILAIDHGPALSPIYVEWRVDGRLAGSVNFLPGQLAKTVLITVPSRQEAHSNPMVVDFAGGSGDRVAIWFDDATLAHDRGDDVVVAENGGTAHVKVTLDPTATSGGSIRFATEDGTAVAGKDYEAKSGTLTLTPSQREQTIDIKILDNATVDGDRRFSVALTTLSGVINDRPKISVVIVDDELSARPSVSIADHVDVPEGNGLGTATIEVKLSAPSTRQVRVGYHTADGSAVAGAAYQTTDDLLTFAPGETVKTISIPIFGDTLIGGNKSFSVVLAAPENATLGNATAAITMIDDDHPEPPRLRPVH